MNTPLYLTPQDVRTLRKHIEKVVKHKIYCEEGLCVAPLPNDSELSFILVANDGGYSVKKVTWPVSVHLVRAVSGEGRVYNLAQAQNVEDAKRIFDLIHTFCDCQ